MDLQTKETWETPELVTFGNIEEITATGGSCHSSGKKIGLLDGIIWIGPVPVPTKDCNPGGGGGLGS